MVTLFIDTASISEDLLLSQEDINSLLEFTVKEITARIAQEWEKEAVNTLTTSRQQYINSINVVDEGFAKGAVVLVGWLPNAVEQGLDGFDMKEGFLNGPNAKTTKSGGRLNVIPFSQGTPGALQENFNGGIMPAEIHSIAKSKSLGQSIKKIDLKNLPAQLREPQKKTIQRPESKVFKDYQHKSSIYEGIVKVKDSVTGQNSYVSFRAVSDNSDPDSWIHPGIEAHHIADKILSQFNVPFETGRVIDVFLADR